jgi:intracellular septation protein A
MGSVGDEGKVDASREAALSGAVLEQGVAAELESPAVRAVLRRAGPRLVRDAFGPLAVFFAGWKLIGLTAGIAMAVVFGVSVFVHERRQGRPAMVVRLALVLVAIRASVGLSSGSATAYLAQEIGIDTLLGFTVLGSLRTARPFASWFSEEFFPLPAEMRESETFSGAMRTITLVWGVYFLARALVRLTALLTLSTNSYVLVAALSDAPFLIALLAWSLYHTTSAFRDSAQWAPVVATAEASLARSESLPG